MKRICILDNQDSFSHNLRLLFHRVKGVEVDVVPTEEYDAQLLDCIDGLVFSPGPGVPDDFPRMKMALRDAEARIPILGVCLGHQAIVEYYGGRLYSLRRVCHGMQSELHVDYSKDGLWKNINNATVGRYHSFVAYKRSLPRELRITAVDQQGRVMAIQHKTRPIFGVQFHPESYMTNCGVALVKNFIAVL